ncbi:MAG TPA: hypothetical protein VHM29_03795, partial [Acidimicrobiia bacterium]|nr:hypothetical protein [Acidimicrobiia bacterium]
MIEREKDARPKRPRTEGSILGHMRQIGQTPHRPAEERGRDAEHGTAPDESAAEEIRIFLVADVRGYTVFTQERGDE